MVEQGAGYCTNHQFLARKGSSAVKRIKTRLRKRLKNDMLNSLLHVSINGPAVSTPEAKEVVNTAVANWLQKKNRRLQRPPISTKKRQQLPWNLFWLTNAPSAILLRPHWMQSNWNLLKNNYKEKCTWQRRPSSCLKRTRIQKVIVHGTA